MWVDALLVIMKFVLYFFIYRVMPFDPVEDTILKEGSDQQKRARAKKVKKKAKMLKALYYLDVALNYGNILQKFIIQNIWGKSWDLG